MKKYFHMSICSIAFFIILCCSSPVSASGQLTNRAVNPNYTVDYPYKTAPSFSSYTVKTVSNETDLATILKDKTQTNIEIQLTNNINLTSTVLVEGDKSINLNGFTLAITNTSAYIGFSNTTTTRQFRICNGKLLGNRNTTSIGSDTDFSNGFITAYASTSSPRIQTVFEDIAYTGNGISSGGFYKGLNTDVYLLGKVVVDCGTYNIRAGNMTFLGDFEGYSRASASPGASSNGSGGINLSFSGYANNYMTGGSENYGDRRIYISPTAKVKLTNDNDSTSSSRGYQNNIGNFASLVVAGELNATAKGTTLRTTASSSSNTANYQGQAGTYNGQANIYVLPGAKFKVGSTAIDGNRGALYTYNTNLYVDAPEIFDMRYFGEGLFFYSYSNSPRSNLYIYNSNIGVWSKANKGVGNPDTIWQNVTSFSLEKFYNADKTGTITSSDSTINSNTFNINNYSRLSNDVALPMIVPDDAFMDQNKIVLKNSATSFTGSTNYYLPGNVLTNNPASNAKVTLKFGSTTLTTTTDENGKWSFTNLDLSKVKGGTTGTLDLVDADQRLAKQVTFTFLDTIPPVVTTQLVKAAQSDTNIFTDPKKHLLSYTDETTTTANLKVEYVTSEADRLTMSKNLGVYDVKVKVSDEAGNSTLVTAPVLVHLPGETITDGFIVGKDFSVDYKTWIAATDAEKRALVIDDQNGDVSGYEVDGNNVTNVTNDPSKLVVSYSNTTWIAKQTYPITLKVNSYTKVINVTLVPSTVKMHVKQVYQNTDAPIFSNFRTNEMVTNQLVKEVDIEDPLSAIIDELIATNELTLNYEGYDAILPTAYKVKQGTNSLVTDKVPDEDFDLVFEYVGQTKIDQVPDFLFGQVQLADKVVEATLPSTAESKLSIINTKEDNWILKASLPNGIKNKEDKYYLGTLIYKKGESDFRLNQSALVIEQKTEDHPYISLNMNSDNQKMVLEQEIGNVKGDYQGAIIWSVEDVIDPVMAK